MKKISLSILLCLATLVFITSLAYSADPQIPTTASSEPSMAPVTVVDMKLAAPRGNTEASLVNVILNLLSSDVEYSLNESTAIILAYSPFATPEGDAQIYQPTSNISVGLKFSF